MFLTVLNYLKNYGMLFCNHISAFRCHCCLVFMVKFYDKFTLVATYIIKKDKKQQLKNSSSKNENGHIFHLSFMHEVLV